MTNSVRKRVLELDWDKLKSRVLGSSFPSAAFDVRADVIKHLANSEDTLYGITKGTGHLIQSVLKAVKALVDSGYVVCRLGPYKRKKRAGARICGLTELGKIAALVLKAPDIDPGFVVGELRKVDVFRDSRVLEEVFRCGSFREAFSYYLLRNLSMMFVEDLYDEMARLAKFVGGTSLTAVSVPLVEAYIDMMECTHLALLGAILDEARSPNVLSLFEKLTITRALDFGSDPCVRGIRELVKSDPEVRRLALRVFEEYAAHERGRCVTRLARLLMSSLLLEGVGKSAANALDEVAKDLTETVKIMLAIKEEVLKHLGKGS